MVFLTDITGKIRIKIKIEVAVAFKFLNNLTKSAGAVLNNNQVNYGMAK